MTGPPPSSTPSPNPTLSRSLPERHRLRARRPPLRRAERDAEDPGHGREARRRAGRMGDPTAGLPRRLLLRRRSEEHTSELQSRLHLVCRLLLEKKTKRSARATSAGPTTPRGHLCARPPTSRSPPRGGHSWTRTGAVACTLR